MRHGHDLFAVRWAGVAEPVRAVERGGPARRGRLSPWTRGVHSPPLSPPHPLFPRVLQAALRCAPGSSAALRPGGLRRLQPPPSGRRNKVPRGGGDRGSAALRDDYGGQRERSGIARAAVPRRAGPQGSSRAILCPSGSHVVICVRPLGWTAELSTSRQTPGEHISH